MVLNRLYRNLDFSPIKRIFSRLSDFIADRKIILGLIVLFIILILFLLSMPKNCKSSDDCFDEASSICKKAKANLVKDNDLLNYYIRGKKSDNCILRITMLKPSEEKSENLRKGLEGRKMDCAVPMSILKEKPLKKIANINDYCTGSLKEAVLEIALQKMYELIVKDLGNVTIALQEVIAGLEQNP